jgi:hypothetical protein
MINQTREQITQWLTALGPVGPWLAALVILIVGWLGCVLVRSIVARLLKRTKLDEKMAKYLGTEEAHPEIAVSRFVFYLLMLFVFVVALDAAKLSAEATQPLREMLGEILAFLPNLIGAALLTFVAFALAGIVRKLLKGVLNASRIDERLGMGDEKPLSTAITTVAYFLVILLILPGILSVLGIESVSTAVEPIISGIIGYIPNAIGGGIILAIGLFLAYIVQKTVYSVLNAANFDNIPQKLGHNGGVKLLGNSISKIVSYLAMVTVIIFVAAQAIQVLDLGMLAGLAGLLIRVWGGVILFLAGLLIAGMARDAIKPHNAGWAKVAYFAVAIFVGGMALQVAQLTPMSSQMMQVILYAAVGTLAVAFGIGGAVAIGSGAKPSVESYLKNKSEMLAKKSSEKETAQPRETRPAESRKS